MRAKRLELIRLAAPDPKSGASAIPPRPHNAAVNSSEPESNVLLAYAENTAQSKKHTAFPKSLEKIGTALLYPMPYCLSIHILQILIVL